MNRTIIWTKKPAPKDTDDIGPSHEARVDGKLLASIGEGGFSTIVETFDPETGKLVRHRYEPNSTPIDRIKADIEAEIKAREEDEK